MNFDKKDLERRDEIGFMYPMDVISAYSKEGKATTEDKTIVGIFVFTTITALLYLVLFLPVLGHYGFPWWLSLLIQLIIEILIFKKFISDYIFGIAKKRKEQEASNSDDVLKYIKMNIRMGTELKISGESAIVFECYDGSLVSAIRFRLGSTDERRSEATRQVMEDIQLLCSKSGFSSKYYTLNEVYEETREYQNFMNTMSGGCLVGDERFDDFRTILLEMADNVVKETTNSNVPSIVLFIKSENAISFTQFRVLLKSIYKKTYANINSIRYLEFLDKEGMLSAVKQYFGIPVLDVSNLSILDRQAEIIQKYKRYGAVYSATSVGGTKVYSDKNILASKFDRNTKVNVSVDEGELPYIKDMDFDINID